VLWVKLSWAREGRAGQARAGHSAAQQSRAQGQLRTWIDGLKEHTGVADVHVDHLRVEVQQRLCQLGVLSRSSNCEWTWAQRGVNQKQGQLVWRFCYIDNTAICKNVGEQTPSENHQKTIRKKNKIKAKKREKNGERETEKQERKKEKEKRNKKSNLPSGDSLSGGAGNAACGSLVSNDTGEANPGVPDGDVPYGVIDTDISVPVFDTLEDFDVFDGVDEVDEDDDDDDDDEASDDPDSDSAMCQTNTQVRMHG
jgi:hypothetical protein